MEISYPDNPTPTLLIVDDRIDNIQVLAIALEMHGYSITYALSGRATFERLEAIKPNLILLDLFMPDMDGLEICEKIKADPNYQDIPILFLSASEDEDHLVTAFQKGAADYLRKPFRTVELLARVKTHIQLQQQAIALKQTRNQLETLANQLDDGVLVVDSGGVIRFANPRSARMLNKSLSELVGHPCDDALLENDGAQIEVVGENGELEKAAIHLKKGQWEDRSASMIWLRSLGRSHRLPAHD
ncbi:response regulator [Oxynema sp. CENA135]|uniref:response regulator n=1 Tax=Oxynema sp. CENA135 TaxID=984206 RepID=UPI00190AAFEE|nr:response regulator [Oxynema sp. CENA135]MBK4730756.1 response regulator [Oxynema sp. CENA135]